MNCNEVRRLLETDLDGELDLVRHLELEAHLRTCAACAPLADAARARRDALRDSLPRFTAPPGLASKISAALPSASAASSAGREHARAPVIRFPFARAAALAASIALALFVGFRWGDTRARSSILLDEAISSHVRSLEVDHLTDVASTDQHTVKPWFSGKLDFSPPVVDLAADGFPLIGGRLDQLARRPAAALVFHRRKHAINLFIWPADGSPLPSLSASRSGYHAVAWTQADLAFLAVSEIPASELAQFAQLFRERTAP